MCRGAKAAVVVCVHSVAAAKEAPHPTLYSLLLTTLTATLHVVLCCAMLPMCLLPQVGARSVLLEGSLMEEYSVLQPGSVLPPTRRVPSGKETECVSVLCRAVLVGWVVVTRAA